MIVDTHVHVVSDNRDKFPVLPDAPAWPPTTGENLIAMMDEAGVDRALLVQTYFTYGYDNSYMTEVARAYPKRFLSVCVLDPLDEAAPDQLSDLVENHRVRGIRLMNDRGRNVISIDDSRTFPLWQRISALRIPVCVASLIDDVPRVAVPLERFPEVPVALDHIWGLKVGDGPDFTRIRPVLDLASFPNLHVKIAPNNSFAVRAANASPGDFYRLLLTHYGPRRLMWGTNYPAHREGYGTFQQRMEIGRQDLGFLNDDERQAVFGGNALSLWPELK